MRRRRTHALLLSIERALERRALRTESDALKRELRERRGDGLEGLLGVSPAMPKVCGTARGSTSAADPEPAALILVVDDDVRTRRILSRMLREDGFDVELAIDGAAAIGRLARSPMPDVLVTDLRMPYADGVAVASYARSHRPGLPVLVVTGHPDLVTRGGDELSPAPTVLSKPLDYARLDEELRRLTGQTKPTGEQLGWWTG